MTDDRSIDRAARSWIESGPTQAPDRVVGAALFLVETTPQERDLRIPWRFPAMKARMRLAAAAVVGVLAVGLVYLNLPGRAQVGPPTSSPSAPPPTLIPAATAVDYTKLPGWIVFEFAGKQAPDGSTQAGAGEHRGLWLIHADGSGLHELAPAVPASGKVNADISPDGRHVIFSAYDSPVLIWEAGIDGGDPTLVSTECSGIPAECMDADPAYSADGKRIAFVRATETSSVLAIRDLASGAVTILESTQTSSSDIWNGQPSWSPDGTQIVYEKVTRDAAQDKVTDTRIFIVNADGSGLHELALPAEETWGDPDWSPDGTRIVIGSYPIQYLSAGNSSASEVYSVRPDGTDLQQLTHLGVGSGAPSWTSDGTHIIYWGFQSLYAMDPDGGNAGPINRAALAFNVDGYGFYGQLQPTP